MIHRGIFYRFYWALILPGFILPGSRIRWLGSGWRGSGWRGSGPGGFEVLARLRKGVLQVEFHWRF